MDKLSQLLSYPIAAFGRLPWYLQVVVTLIPLLLMWAVCVVAARNPKWRKKDLEAYLYLYPALLILGVFHFAPVFYSIKLSLYRSVSISQEQFVGLGNYVRIWNDSQFWESLVQTVYFVIGMVPGSIILSLGVAMLLNTAIAGKGLYRTLYFLPVITSIAAVSIVWKWIFNSEYGLLNHWLGWERYDWLQQNDGVLALLAQSVGIQQLPRWMPEGPSIAMISVIVMSIWKQLGYNAVIFLAGLQNIPRELYEVAKIDGANAWSQFRNITWPLLSPTTYFILVITTIQSFQVFAQIFMLYDGMPSDSTRVLVFYLYDVAFKSNDFGYASALAYALFGIILALTVVQRKLAESRVHYQ